MAAGALEQACSASAASRSAGAGWTAACSARAAGGSGMAAMRRTLWRPELALTACVRSAHSDSHSTS